MDARAFDAFLTQIAQLTCAQYARVLTLLTPIVNQAHGAEVIEQAVVPRLCRRRCQSKGFSGMAARAACSAFAVAAVAGRSTV